MKTFLQASFLVLIVWSIMLLLGVKEAPAALNYKVTCYVGDKIIYDTYADFDTYKENYFKFNDGRSIFITNATCTIKLR